MPAHLEVDIRVEDFRDKMDGRGSQWVGVRNSDAQLENVPLIW